LRAGLTRDSDNRQADDERPEHYAMHAIIPSSLGPLTLPQLRADEKNRRTEGPEELS